MDWCCFISVYGKGQCSLAVTVSAVAIRQRHHLQARRRAYLHMADSFVTDLYERSIGQPGAGGSLMVIVTVATVIFEELKPDGAGKQATIFRMHTL